MKNYYLLAIVVIFLSLQVKLFGQTYHIVGTQSANNLSNPFPTEFNDSRYQYILTAAELTASGLVANNSILAIAYNITTTRTHVMNGLTISMKHTSANTLSSFDNVGFTQVYTGNNAMSTTGWIDLTFQNNFVWNGTDNILIQVCYDNTTNAGSGNNVLVTYRGTGSNRAVYERSNSTGASGCGLTTSSTSVNVPITRFFVEPGLKPVFQNYSQSPSLTTSFAHRRCASEKPKFTIKSNTSFNAIQIELNTLANFSGTAITSTISNGTTYNANTSYDFWTTTALPAGDRTYFVRARLSTDGGSTWGVWSTQLWPYSFYATTPYPKEGWYYTTQEQFQSGVVQESLYNFTSIENNSTSYPDDDYIQLNEGVFSINASNGDAVYENGTFYPSVNYMTIGWQNNCNGNAAIYNGFPFTVNIPKNALLNSADFSVVATNACVCESQNVPLYLIFDAHDADNGPPLTATNTTSTTTPTRTTAKETFLYNSNWTNDTRYTLTTVKPILQSIINRSGWNAGNTFNLLGRWNNSYSPGSNNNRCIRQADNGSTTAPRLDGTFTNFYNTINFPTVDRAIYGSSVNWDELRITDNTVGCGSCYTEYRIHDASTNTVLAGPFIRNAGLNGSQYFDISSVSTQNIYVSARIYRSNSPVINDIWLTVTEPLPLPIELINFEGKCEGNNINFNWEIASELNTDYFVIESSIDGKEWQKEITINAIGKSNSINNYSSSIRANDKTAYFKLNIIDFDGKLKTLSTIKIDCQLSDVFIYPNPNNGTFTINGASEGSYYQIINAIGQVIKEDKISSNSSIINISEANNGAYLVRIHDNDNIYHFKINVAK